MVHTNADSAASIRMILHGLQEDRVDTIDEIKLLMVVHLGVHTEGAQELVLDEFPAKSRQTDYDL